MISALCAPWRALSTLENLAASATLATESSLMVMTPAQLDALQALVFIGMERAAETLNEMLHEPMRLRVSSLCLVPPHDLPATMAAGASKRLAAVQLGFRGSLVGTMAMFCPAASAAQLVLACTKDGHQVEYAVCNGLNVDAFSEVGTIVMTSIMDLCSSRLQQVLQYTLPLSSESTLDHYMRRNYAQAGRMVFLTDVCLTVAQLAVPSNMLLLVEASSFAAFLSALNVLLEPVEP